MAANNLTDVYIQARSEYGDRYASLAQRIRNWQLTAFAFFLLGTLASVTVVIQARQVKMLPYLVLEDRLGNIISVPSTLSPSNHQIDLETETRVQVLAFIGNVRSVSIDPITEYNRTQDAKALLTGRADNYVHDWLEENNPFKVAHTHGTDVRVTSIVLRPNPYHQPGYSYDVRWTERTYDAQGRTSHDPDTHWLASLHAVSTPPSDDPLRNPGGTRIDWISWGPDEPNGTSGVQR